MSEQSARSVANTVARDTNLSLKAKGLYLLIKMCLRDSEFDFMHFKPALEAECKEGGRAFDSAWKELKKAGYLKQYRAPYCEGVGFHYAYKLLVRADASTPSLETLKGSGKSIPLRRQTEQGSAE